MKSSHKLGGGGGGTPISRLCATVKGRVFKHFAVG